MSATRTASAPAPRSSIIDAPDECGCKAGALAASVALLLYLVVVGTVPWIRAQPGWVTWTAGVFVIFGSAIAGKVLGLQLAIRDRKTLVGLDLDRS